MRDSQLDIEGSDIVVKNRFRALYELLFKRNQIISLQMTLKIAKKNYD